jgi:hypothetical protein
MGRSILNAFAISVTLLPSPWPGDGREVKGRGPCFFVLAMLAPDVRFGLGNNVP